MIHETSISARQPGLPRRSRDEGLWALLAESFSKGGPDLGGRFFGTILPERSHMRRTSHRYHKVSENALRIAASRPS